MQWVLLLHAECLALDVQFLWAPPATAENIWKRFFFFAVRVLKLLCSCRGSHVIDRGLCCSPHCVLRCEELQQELAGFCCSHHDQAGFAHPDVPRGTWRLLGRVKIWIFTFFFSCCNKEQSMCCISLNLEQNLFGKLLQIKPCILFMVGQTRRVKEALPRAAAVLCQPQGHGNTAVPGSAGQHSRNGASSLAHVSSFLELARDDTESLLGPLPPN